MPRALPALLLLAWVSLVLADEGLPPGVRDTQNPKDKPPTPQEAVRAFQAPAGCQVTLFAGEPAVAQPIALATDPRGRLWVAECYSYPEWKATGQDRIVVFSDEDGDGRYDKRTVFKDGLANLSSIEIGYGGVWALCAPYLYFFPDKNGDDVPDGPPEVKLDGWTFKIKHNIVNGLIWGPDGWLWGCHGILAESRPGKPGTPMEKRPPLNCGIWRYHPTREILEVVCHGTTNPWGLDFDEHGEAFFTNCVIGHLWHVIPGAHYKRMYGLDYNPFTYDLIDATSEHLHWGGGDWTSSRSGKGVHDDAGGGHAHSGALVYLGDNWPVEYRNSILMCNIHGNRLNRDLLRRRGNGYVGQRGPDLLRSSNPWFRGVTLRTGAEGAVYIADWCDFGECHDDDGTHRSSGRIYRAAFGQTTSLRGLDLRKKSTTELVELLRHPNDWYSRQARVLLAERATAAGERKQAAAALRRAYAGERNPVHQLRMLWALHGIGEATPEWLVEQLRHPDEHLRAWAVRLLGDLQPDAATVHTAFLDRARVDPSGLVRLHLAGLLQRLPMAARWPIATALAAHAEDARDRCQPLMLWYGIESAVPRAPREALALAAASRIPLLRQFIARRLAEASDQAAGLEPILAAVSEVDESKQRDFLQGLRDGLKGRKRLGLPSGWPQLQTKLEKAASPEIRGTGQLLALVFDAPGAVGAVRRTVQDKAIPAEQRQTALAALVERRVPDLAPLATELLAEPALRGAAIRALAVTENDATPKTLLDLYASLTANEKQDVIATLSARPRSALALLEAIENGRVPRRDLSAFTARQLQDLGHAEVRARLTKVWGQSRASSQERRQRIEQYKQRLGTDVLAKADPDKGKLVFQRTCQQCHTLHGTGGRVGPDLTGSNRTELHYVLENLLDPSAFISRDYQLTNFVTQDGRLVAGIVVEETPRAVTVQTATDRLVLSKEDIEARKVSPVSMMPEGIVEQMSFEELRDLVAYLAIK